MGCIYVLSNPSFQEFVKIGYADNVDERLQELNRSECLPFAFRLRCKYEVPERLLDTELHAIIDMLNPDLRAVEKFNGKIRKREFYNMTADDACALLNGIAVISGTKGRLTICGQNEEAAADEKAAESMASSVSFTEEDHLERTSKRELYRTLKSRIFSLKEGVSISVNPGKLYVSFAAGGDAVFLAVIFQRNQLKLTLNVKDGLLDDPCGFARSVAGVGHWGAGDYQLHLNDEQYFEDKLRLVEQALTMALQRPAAGNAPAAVPVPALLASAPIASQASSGRNSL